MNHTPLPWTCRLWANEELPPDLAALAKERGMNIERIPLLGNQGERFISSESGRICTVDAQSKFKRGEGHRHDDAERDANVALILKAVNNHQKLVDALQAMCKAELFLADHPQRQAAYRTARSLLAELEQK